MIFSTIQNTRKHQFPKWHTLKGTGRNALQIVERRKRIKDDYISKHLSVLLGCLFSRFEELRGLNEVELSLSENLKLLLYGFGLRSGSLGIQWTFREKKAVHPFEHLNILFKAQGVIFF